MAEDPAPDEEPPELLLWRPPAAPTRGPRRALTLREVARAAVRVADEHGLAALSMHRVASELVVTKMALYRYVTGKAQLEALMIDEAVEEPPLPADLPAEWRAAAEVFAGLVSDVWSRHPWLPAVTVGDRLMVPREVGWVEAAVRLFEPTGLSAGDRMDAVTMLFSHIRTTHASASAGTRPWTAGPDHTSSLRALLAENATSYPALLAAMSEQPGPSAPGAPEQAAARGAAGGMAFGLRCLLDGIEAAAARPRTGCALSRPPAG